MLSAAPFHTSVNKWFGDHFAAPTEVQVRSWPLIAQGRHVLITAPTGSGKTLTAFLWSLSQFATGTYATGRTQVLYISPLKALNNDIQRNLLQPLRELQEHYGYPNVRVHTRSGDTPQSDRQRMLRKPPDILVTTPESLNLLLTTVKGRQALSHVSTVIIDEIHALADNRRGAHLMTSLERLADIAGEFQRIALSATVSPLDAIAHYVGGRDAAGHLRRMDIVNPTIEKTLQFRVRFPEAARHAAENGQKIWEPLANDFRDIIASNHSTLFFTNSRRLAERITLKINDASLQPVAYAHHGSLSREIRTEVEQRLKDGSLKAIVSTNSLEMGIDIGHLDEVVMVQSHRRTPR
jgi:ATP-dependent Lhr-like helicase